MDKTLVIGLDGANWELVDRWIEARELPNLKKMKENGMWSDQESELPPVTFPNWKCYSTGKDPSQLGVHWFEKVDKEKEDIRIIDSTEFDSKEIWDYLGEKYKVGIINMPTMYPPKKVNGFMVCGGPSTTEGEYRSVSGGYTYPEELEMELEEMGYRVHPENIPTKNKESEKEVEEILGLIEKRFDLAERRLDEVDFLHITLFYLNVLQHFFWDGEPTRKAWKLIDEKLGEFMDKDVNIILMSDHGCCEIDTVFNINTWLEREGYLKTKKTTEDFLSKFGLTKERAFETAKKLGIAQFLIKIIPDSIQKILPREEGVKRERKAEKIDWKKSDAFAGNQGPIYVLNKEKEGEIKDKLEKLKGTNGKEVAGAVYKFEDRYGKEPDKNSPDLIVDQREGVHIDGAIGPEKAFDENDRWRAENKKTGLFLAYGENFKDGYIGKTSILDLAPTILDLYGIEMPEDMKGRVLEEIYS